MEFPSIELSPYATVSPDRAVMLARLSTQFRLTQGYVGSVLVLSAAALQRKAIPRQGFVDRCDLIAVEEEQDRDELIAKLESAGYARTQVVDDPGTYAVRGSIVDCFPPLYRFPTRIEFFADIVESIRLFDPASQRTLRAIDEVVFYPVKETLRGDKILLRQKILETADANQYPSRATKTLLETLESGQDFLGLDALAPAFHPEMHSLTRYIPETHDIMWVLLDMPRLAAIVTDEFARAEQAYRQCVAEQHFAFSPEHFFLTPTEFAAQMAGHPQLHVGGFEVATSETVLVPQVTDHAQLIAELTRLRHDKSEEVLKALARALRLWLEEEKTVVIATGNLSHGERLEALLKGHTIETTLRRDSGIVDLLNGETSTEVILQPGELQRGFCLPPPSKLVFLTESEIFGERSARRPARKISSQALSDLRDLAIGDYVVHAEHGVGTYKGLVKLSLQGVSSDFLLIEYAGSDKLYVPVYRMNLVHKFVGGEAHGQIKLDRLGGITWQKKTTKVRDDVRKLGEELLQLYAQRAALKGFAFKEPDAMYREFEASFPFTETADQLAAIDDVLHDLTSDQPMDRLICGDVGFGKTEVALRAAFLATLSGKQVCLLAPTTILVEQHARTFTDRMNAFPIKIETLSRFRKPQELRDALTLVAQGKVDIAIGTHRLLSADVRFKDLGLLIIDEEQRFGVAHKEKLKQLRTQVDVLTLSATPIPRTLQMGMVGLREISIISTPPVDRLAIRTFVSRYDETLVAEAIRKELARGGQVFFVHNRIEDIAEWAERVSAAVPEARVIVGHGQMDADRLETVMLDFISGKYDVLVSTTIIESGLDIPRANTMFINQADRFGLSQLYQLRGRIGRSRHRAYCYLLAKVDAITDEARQRLDVLQRFTELGSGFSIASYDLEIRGAGDLLGAKQSGLIAAIGFEAYARILEEAVAELRGKPITRETDPEIKASISAYIPDDYVEDTGQRLELYQRLSMSAHDQDAIFEILTEIEDRYGPKPKEVEALGQLMIIKGLAADLRATHLEITAQRLALMLSEGTPLRPELIAKWVSDKQSGFRITPEMRLIRTFNERETSDLFETTKNVLRGLLRAC